MGGFEILDHTADVGVAARGETLAEALSWLATGMFSVIADLERVGDGESLEVSVSSHDTGSLVVDWLNELLYQHEALGLLPKEFDVSVDADGKSLTARCAGETFDAERHRGLTAVKAATYHQLEVSHNGEWRIQVVLDV